MQDNINFSALLDPHRLMLRRDVPNFARGIAQDIRREPGCVNEKRVASLAYLRKLKETLRGANDRWIANLPADSPSRGVDFALVHFLTSNLKYPDTGLASDLTKGMPLVGNVPASGVFTSRVREPVSSIPRWNEGLEERNRATVRRVSHPTDKNLARLCWEKSLQEVEKGWLSKPVPVTEAAIRAIPLPPRFAIEEEHGGQGKKIRVIDDLKASQVNDLLGLVDTSIPPEFGHISGNGNDAC